MVRGWFRCYVGLVQGFFRVGLGIILGWCWVYVGRFSAFFKVGLAIYFWLVQGWLRIYVGLVCGSFEFAYDFFRVGSCLFNRLSLGFI